MSLVLMPGKANVIVTRRSAVGTLFVNAVVLPLDYGGGWLGSNEVSPQLFAAEGSLRSTPATHPIWCNLYHFFESHHFGGIEASNAAGTRGKSLVSVGGVVRPACV